ncbi:hypothetical protein NY551_17390 [Curtobacterium flaccumfaciens pv. oortii]|nr:hypothetical protein [Curtobacterium flaccumfaciens]MCS5524513.1 hypothetical protein [Curtobacterium flaccumfaciens pv. oortii]
MDTDEHGDNAWATCAECGTGWVHRDELPEQTSARTRTPERQAA